jgi:hypothetical protein
MARAVASIADIQDVLGHESDKMTRHYAGEARKFAAAELMTSSASLTTGFKNLMVLGARNLMVLPSAERCLVVYFGLISSSEAPRSGFEPGTPTG